MTGRTEKALEVKSMLLNDTLYLSDTEELIEDHEEELLEMMKNESLMKTINRPMQEIGATIILEIADKYGLEVEIVGVKEELD